MHQKIVKVGGKHRPSISMDLPGVEATDDFGKLLQSMLKHAILVKQTEKVDPALHKSDMLELFDKVDTIFPTYLSSESRKQVIDAAARAAFNNLLASTTIDSPEFVNLWNLLDIIAILSDDEQTEPGLLFWLIEELLDSQTIAGCRKIFDYLESRREKITAKHFQSKNLIILRSCNELLRRLSRAEDTAFCGRVFIFLFQSFPLGDKSSVNLRGEYHTENITTYDSHFPQGIVNEHLQSDPDIKVAKAPNTQKEALLRGFRGISDEQINNNTSASFMKDTNMMSGDQLYPVFWSLQNYFSHPKKLFDKPSFRNFQAGLEATMTKFKSVQKENITDRTAKSPDNPSRIAKRKRGHVGDGISNAFNPKYLTSRDLFELEISDLSFRRHILVQSLIILDFLLSLSAKSKEKLSKAAIENYNKSVMYTDQLLSEEDTNWVLEMKKLTAEYLKQSQDGPFFYRMVETVLSRDKNWARWKIENCPSIARPSITPQEYSESKTSARKITTSKRLRPNPIGSFDLRFLAEVDRCQGLERLKDYSRYLVPEIKSFKNKLELDNMDLEMAQNDEQRDSALLSKASKSWRALRIARTSKLNSFDKIERADKIDTIFEDHIDLEESRNADDDLDDSEEYLHPKEKRPTI
ncbi:BgTH12-02437 [Blumeria graminis f. sp. triticale]|uniref:BgTH12-02437 n=1 Tax=Blumeria graminis f. sp. triticale TaxID=1689686 RepID=A0A9W4D106_BLUGR|nr:BgTH12-02437 [Blumeria graminis f. sp. triticale]